MVNILDKIVRRSFIEQVTKLRSEGQEVAMGNERKGTPYKGNC